MACVLNGAEHRPPSIPPSHLARLFPLQNTHLVLARRAEAAAQARFGMRYSLRVAMRAMRAMQ